MAGFPWFGLPLVLSLVPVGQSTPTRPPVVVVEGDYMGDGGGQGDSQAFFGNVCAALEAACVQHEVSKDSTVEKWGLPASCRVALLPYNRAVSAGELAHLRAFLQRGGKVIVFYVGPDELLLAAGVRAGEVVKAEREGQFAGMVFRNRTAASGTDTEPRDGVGLEARPTSLGVSPLPGELTQSSWNVRRCEAAEGAVVLGNWVDSNGADTGLPAVVLGRQGAFFSHVFTAEDLYRKGLVLRAIIGHFEPTIWPGAIRAELEQINAVGRFGTLARLRDYLAQRAQAGQRVEAPLTAAERALELREVAQQALNGGDPLSAAEAATAARTAAAEAFWATYPAKPGELRGAWMIYRGRPTWDATMRNLRAANLNAVMPRFCSAGAAYFPSQYLPRAAYLDQHGDQLAQATAAAARHGIPVHARMLALIVYEAPEGVRDAYARAGRLMVSTTGETESWLCPSHPENRKAVVGACLEMARYPVAGIQLDYIRYPWTTYCYCKTCKAKFQRDLQVTVDQWPFDCSQGKYRGRFADWRREQITGLVREIRLRLKDLNPNLAFSADVFVNWEGHRESFGQDWKAWVDEGLLDFACPMDYFGKDETFISWVTRQRQWTRWETPMCVGIGPRADGVQLDPQQVLTQVELSRRLGGDGWVLFEYDEALAAEHLPVVGSGVSSEATAFTWGPPTLRCEATPIPGGCRAEYRLDTGAGFPAPMRDAGTASLNLPGVVVQSAELSLCTADAWPVFDLGAIAADQPTSREFALAPGAYRLCAQGTCVRPGASGEERFVRWGPVVDVE